MQLRIWANWTKFGQRPQWITEAPGWLCGVCASPRLTAQAEAPCRGNLIFGGDALAVVDHERLEGNLLRLEFQAELFLYGGEDRWQG